MRRFTVNNTKKIYETIEIEITPLSSSDVIKTSGAFNGIDDLVANWI